MAWVAGWHMQNTEPAGRATEAEGLPMELLHLAREEHLHGEFPPRTHIAVDCARAALILPLWTLGARLLRTGPFAVAPCLAAHA